MKTTQRTLTILILAFGVLLVWALISRTPWAGTVDPLTAGEAYTHPIEPLRDIAGALLVAIPAVLLIRSGWSWFARVILGRDTPQRSRVQRTMDPAHSVRHAKFGE
ncbi:MAG: hypothetical protein U9N78_02555 [Actinomycetota bacterium]|nr:hypothetical protein [Actinomycetota bacterium]